MTSKFARFDTQRPDGVYVHFSFLAEIDDITPTDRDYLCEAEVEAWRNGEWDFYGIRAVAHVRVVRNGTGTHYELTSAGVWGVQWNGCRPDQYVQELYNMECEALLEDLKQFGSVQVAT